jgi:hypothetical protein
MVKLIFLDYWLGKNLKLNDLMKLNRSISFYASFVICCLINASFLHIFFVFIPLLHLIHVSD